MKNHVFFFMSALSVASFSFGDSTFESDTIKTSTGPLVLTFIKHGTLLFEFNKIVIHIDPVSMYADYTEMTDADIVLVTHEHFDHLDPKALGQITKAGTQIICTESCSAKVKNGMVMKNGDVKEIKEIKIEAVPAYNIVHMREKGKPFHPKGVGNGYVLTFGDTRVYIGGDTENVPEMKNLKDIDIAFLPMNLPYTMTPKMVADAAAMFNPKILYPYHYGDTRVGELVKLLKDKKGCEVRIRNLQ